MTTDYRIALYAAIDKQLSGVLENQTVLPGWHEAWQRLTLESTQEERLAVYQAIRDSGVLPENAGFYLVRWQVYQITEGLVETVLSDLDKRLDSIRKALGLAQDEFWEPGEAPAEYEQVSRDYERASDDLFIQTLEAHGEHALAALYRADSDAFERRDEEGRQYFHGSADEGIPDDAEWLDLLLDVVGACINPESPMDSLSLLHREEEGFWEVDVFPTAVEVVGGADDGAVVTPLFSVDLAQLHSAFDHVSDFGWNAFGWHDGDGPFVWIEGVHLERPLLLRVLAQDPGDEESLARIYVR